MVLRLKLLRGVCLAIFLPLLAQPCLAGGPRQIGGVKLFVSVDAEGVVLYTDVAPADADDAAGTSLSARSQPVTGTAAPLRRPAVANGVGAGSTDLAAAEVVAETAEALSGESAPLANSRPELRDGGLPPEDR
ncbi:hypothetical protein CKO20_00930 [Rhodocyclus tenuis]|nr:hypothetical protein [Rhodocyclus tenuis]